MLRAQTNHDSEVSMGVISSPRKIGFREVMWAGWQRADHKDF